MFVMSHIDARVGERIQSAQVDVAYELPVQAVTESIVNATGSGREDVPGAWRNNRQKDE